MNTQAEAAAERYRAFRAANHGAHPSADDLGPIFGEHVEAEAPLANGTVVTTFADGSRARLSAAGLAVYDPSVEKALAYPIVLEPEAGGGFSVHVVGLAEAHTQGETAEECLANARDVIALVLERRAETGERAPDPAPAVWLPLHDAERGLLALEDAIDGTEGDVKTPLRGLYSVLDDARNRVTDAELPDAAELVGAAGA